LPQMGTSWAEAGCSGDRVTFYLVRARAADAPGVPIAEVVFAEDNALSS